ncbi:MAG: PfkB family carbohydrate kinase [Phycisphaerae bacterium]
MPRSLLVVGSIALDSIRSPHGEVEEVLGGSAVYFSVAASLFAPVRLVGVVGEDFPDEHHDLLRERRVETDGLTVVDGGKTFRWRGYYKENMNVRVTEDVQLNVFGDFRPVIPAAWRGSDLVFLANGSPVTQMSVLEQVERPALSIADTMNLWIETTRDDLLALLQRIDGLVLNDEEAEMLTGETDLERCEDRLLEMGPRFIILKLGSEGARIAGRARGAPGAAGPEVLKMALPAFRRGEVRDPTGAGDSFAGGLMGYLAGLDRDVTLEDLPAALKYGTVTASFTIEDFGVQRLADLTAEEFEQRLAAYDESVTA